MFKFLPYVLKTLWRHRSRTILTVSGSAVALFVFCFIGAVQQGMNNLESRESCKAIAGDVSGKQILPVHQSFAAGLRGEDQKGQRRSRSRPNPGVHEQLPGELGCDCVLRRAAAKIAIGPRLSIGVG